MSALTDFLLPASTRTSARPGRRPRGRGCRCRSATPTAGTWRARGTAHRDVAVDRAAGACRRPDAAHITHWDPVRVRAECDARRRIVQLQQSDLREDPLDREADEVLHLLAVPYAGHPDHRRTWRP